ncbi:hypothetical protein L1F28_33230 [Arthrospira platensis NCB002]|uniref:Uncharacterized protein n=3 Tax=Sirenicapillariaceae TaxID=2934961 RepID=A0A5M3TAZ2_LIMPL|nr:hypothetical protein APPUASWS_021840 [Arthrospira platensis str. Paraca]MDF2213442.1 hypothetical protein [Arthrospira platensis NCB002]BDT14093.1 hypothetical protein N39L_38160 [Arthrospira platensis NIES-39]GCE96674.1 hypothetical protein NIES46_47460 [Arthrospira platensis NIES-46]
MPDSHQNAMKNSTPTPADALIAALHEPGRENLLDLVQNPLCLTMLCMIWDGSLPDTQAELYQRYLRKIYEWNQNLNDLEKYAEVGGTNTTKLKQNLNRQLGGTGKGCAEFAPAAISVITGFGGRASRGGIRSDFVGLFGVAVGLVKSGGQRWTRR